MKNIALTILKILTQPERSKMARLVLLDVLISVMDIAFLFGLLLLINYYTGHTKGNYLVRLLAGYSNQVVPVGLFFGLFACKNLAGYLITSAQSNFFYQVASRLSEQNIKRYFQESYQDFTATDSSVNIRKISQQPIEFSNYILTNVQQIITQSVMILLTISAILLYHPGFFLSLFLLLVPPVILVGFFIRKKLKAIRANTKLTSQRNLQYLNESLSGFIESNVYAKEDFFSGRYLAHQQQLNRNIATQQTLQSLPSRLIEVFAVMGLLTLIALSKANTTLPGISILSIGVFMAAAYKIIPGIVKILNATGQIKTYEFILTDLLPSTIHHENFGADKPDKLHCIKFEKVNSSYPDSCLIQHPCFELHPGDFAGISRPSGQGKTTMINLLLGFLETHAGNIFFNDQHTTAIQRRTYWSRISYNKQQPFFINDTLIKNITLSDDAHDAAKLARVMAFCGIDEMLPKYPEDILQRITENGKNISGGQRQRLALARALYHDFDLLILDEPFSEMDQESEQEILTKLQKLAAAGKMILLITHNKTSLNFCNKIIALDE